MEAKLGVLLILVSIMVGSARGSVCAASCDNSTKPLPHEGSRVPDPTDCYQYFVCSDVDGDHVFEISDGPIECPEGEYFSDSGLVCQPIPSSGVAPCGKMCNPCAVICTSPGTLLPNPYDCQQYFICLADNLNDPITSSCKNDEVFDYITGTCLKDGKCYDFCDPCEVYCVAEGRIPDPTDCTSYYYCEPPEGLAIFHCTEGEYYDAGTNKCEEDGGRGCKASCLEHNVSSDMPYGIDY